MYLIFCHPFDRDAIWLYLELKKRSETVQLLAVDQVLMAREWTQSMENGNEFFVVTTKDGTTIKSGELELFFNRVQFVDAPLWRRAPESEREYVRSEMTAMLMSWLHQVQQQCMMINPPFGQSLCGPPWYDAQWAKAAFEAGFQNVSFDKKLNNCEKMLVVGTEVISALNSETVAERCIRLARASRSQLCEVFMRDSGNTFVSATATPAFRAYGKVFLANLQQYLSRNKL